jgi:glycosyltransferase involved in cell wall biosynthesis
VQDIHTGWCEALRELGQHVIEYNLDDRLTFFSAMLRESDREGVFRRALTAEQAYELAADGLHSTLYKAWPDVLLVISGFFIPADLLVRARRTRTRVVIVHTESPYEDDRQLKLAPFADVNLINDPINLERFAALATTRYVPHAYRPSVHHPGPGKPELATDLAFVGTGFPSRIDFFERMDLSDVDVTLGGNWNLLSEESPLYPFIGHDLDECVDNADAADVYRSAKLGINLYRREAERPELSAGWSMGPREVEMAACGLPFLRDPRGEGDEILDMLPTFDSPEAATDVLRWLLSHEDERARIAAKARAAVADRTFRNNAAGLLRLLDP